MTQNIVVLTGAGISAESGLATFRDSDGLWENHHVEDVATPEAFRRDPELVHRFYDARRASLDGVVPNAAHHALARLQVAAREHGGRALVVTQNVDDLHDRAAAEAGADPRDLLHMHGTLRQAWCLSCGGHPDAGRTTLNAPCPGCGAVALRPDVVWFGEIPRHMDAIEEALWAADLFVSVGTSGAVYPAAGFVQLASAAGADTLELNLVPSDGSALFARSKHGPATDVVPAWVEETLATLS
ncbi:NAD-dependent protein deacylase [Marmoricola endophyticus]|uniref:NAD-dependent protein deacylase n=1 Tax=Marmoricola endophyticus TaxID=2040280 RepID=A0A917F3I1_9ACTN|nr:NAD-dependent deacylase [Marmoricola endophyticus]GGF46583.1 NAD-dependent protein deacylase [Marmoricola endophyticus]